MQNENQFIRRMTAVLMASALIVGLLPGFVAAQDLSIREARSACASRVYPPHPPNEGILFVDHSKNNRGGHLGHALVQYAPGKILAFYPNCSSDHGGHGGSGGPDGACRRGHRRSTAAYRKHRETAMGIRAMIMPPALLFT